jgi:hypothetical protein
MFAKNASLRTACRAPPRATEHIDDDMSVTTNTAPSPRANFDQSSNITDASITSPVRH